MYILEITESCERDIKRCIGKDRIMQIRIDKKVEEILRKPLHYKPMGNILYGLRRVQIGPFVLLFSVDEVNEIVTLAGFDHHDKAYEKSIR